MNLDHYFRSLFPPLPSTVYGMIRTARLCDYAIDLDRLDQARWSSLPAELLAEIGEWGKLGSLRMRGPWIVRSRDTNGSEPEILLPAPADLGLLFEGEASGEDAAPNDVVRYLPVDVDRARRNWSHRFKLMEPYLMDGLGAWRKCTSQESQAAQSAEGWFVTCAGMERWLSGYTPRVEDLVRSSALWSVERRIGVGLENATRTTKESQLFSYGYVRLRANVSLGFEISGCDLRSSRIAWLGGEGRVVHIEHGPSLSSRFGESPHSTSSQATLYLATPAVFNGPEASAPSSPTAYAAAVRSSVHIGGWDLARGGPKPLRRGVNAGSMYYVETEKSIRSYLPISDMHEQGFGLALAGIVPEGGS